MRNLFLFFLSVLLLFCCSENTQKDYFFEIKALEFQRNSDPVIWQELYNEIPDTAQQVLLLEAASKVKSPELIPFFKAALDSGKSISLKRTALFALGQTGASLAEDLLLSLSFESLEPALRHELLFALTHCCSEKTVLFFKSLLADNIMKKDVLNALALCHRKNLGKTFVPKDSTTHMSYYFSVAAKNRHIPRLVKLLNAKEASSNKYLLKSLLKIAQTDSNVFKYWMLTDSTLFPSFQNSLEQILKARKAGWELYYAVQLLPFSGDSVLTARLDQYASSSDNHLHLAAIRSFVLAKHEQDVVSFVLDKLENEKNAYLRGRLLKILAELDSQTAFRIIMQDLDRGSDQYKAALLDALAATGLKSAKKTLHQFIQVPNPVLANRAFENLANLKIVRKNDFETLLSSESFSSVSIALEWAYEHKYKVSTEKLLHIYSTFNKAEQFEAQNSVLKMLSRKVPEPDSTLRSLLWNSACHPFLLERIPGYFKNVSWSNFDKPTPLKSLPAFFQVDSLIQYQQNPRVEIQTRHGKIEIELYPAKAPLTVANFVHLAKTGFYKNLIFHRVVPDFVVQGGDPMGDGWGGTDYLIPSSFCLQSLTYKGGRNLLSRLSYPFFCSIL